MSLNKSTIELIAVGDMCFSNHPLCKGFGVKSQILKNGLDHPLAMVTDLLQAGDVVIGNLETALAETSEKEQTGFLSDPGMAGALAKNHFDLMSVANNHSLQHGEAVFAETIDHLAENGIDPVGVHNGKGFSSTPVYFETGGQTLAFLGYSFATENFHPELSCYARSTADQVFADVSRLATEVDHVVVSCHWGVELADSPPPGIVAMGRGIIDAGARVVLGHHPHVWQGVENYNDGVIFYSLGDFIFDLSWCRACRDTGVARIFLSKEKPPRWEVVPMIINGKYQPEPMKDGEGKKFHDRLDKLSGQLSHISASVPLEEPSAEFMARVEVLVDANQRAKTLHVLKNLHHLGWKKILMLAMNKIRPQHQTD